MIRRFPAALAALLAAGSLACAPKELVLPSHPSPAPVPRPSGGLRAGFARVEITPPPGPSTVGYGPEARRARGWRGRLYARAMVLEDAAGERIALVQLDLGMASIYIHRHAAERVDRSAGIGADRLILTATHTHSGPGHFLAVPAIDEFGGAPPGGFDPELADSLATRIARAVSRAAAGLQPARAAWSIEPLWGHTRIRSHAAFRLNHPQWRYRGPIPDSLSLRERGVDPDWRMLRVDVDSGGRWVPRGAFSVFTIHGTGITAQNDLFDPDIQGVVSRRMEVAMDSLAAAARGEPWRRSPARRSVFLLANGAEGDVSPDVPEETRCPTPRIVRGRRHTGPRTPPQADVWRPVSRRVLDACLDTSKAATAGVGEALAAHALAQYQALGARITMDPRTGDLRIARAFSVLPLRVRGGAVDSLCAEPLEGTGAIAGAEDGYTRMRGWRLFGFLGRGFGLPRDTLGNETGRGCHSPKHIALAVGQRQGRLQELVLGDHGLPEAAQISAFRIGEVLIGTLPAEPTTTVGARIRASMAAAAGMQADSAVVVSVTNGYLHYITTPEEYRIPFYEGSSTEYGPRSAGFFQRALTALAASLHPAAPGPPPARVDPLSGWRKVDIDLAGPPDAGPAPSDSLRTLLARCWSGDVLVVRWLDLYPARMNPEGAPLVRIDRHDAWGTAFVTWDDDSAVEIRAIGSLAPRGYEWEMRFRPPTPPADAYHVTFPARQGMRELDGGWFRVGDGGRCPHLR
jgi:neutral ceramidase